MNSPVAILSRTTAACALLIILFISSAPANSADLLKYKLRDLNSNEMVALDTYRGDVTVLMFFEPDCPFCFKQSKVLGQLQTECADFQALAVGVNGNRKHLQEELHRIRPDFPAYQVSSALQKDVGKVEGTPLMLISNKQGQFHTHLRGYQKLDAILPALVNAGLVCSA